MMLNYNSDFSSAAVGDLDFKELKYLKDLPKGSLAVFRWANLIRNKMNMELYLLLFYRYYVDITDLLMNIIRKMYRISP